MKKTVIVVGGGASGMAAAITAARGGASVTILEHTPRLGKKLLSTGNGKCNLTNLSMPKDAYRGTDRNIICQVLQKTGVEETLKFFRGIGIVTTDRNGYVYPASGQASSVLDALRFELEHLGVNILYSCHVKRILPGMTVETSEGRRKADAVILCPGSKAAPSTGSDGSGYKLAADCGHRIVKPLPALVQLRCQGKWHKQAAGVRAEAKVTLLSDGKALASDQGEVQFTDYGISGIPVFQVSRYGVRALEEGRRVTAVLDLCPEIGERELKKFLENRKNMLSYRPAEEFLNGMINKKLAGVVLKEAGIGFSGRTGQIGEEAIEKLARKMKNLTTQVTASNPFENAQVCSGGVDLREIHPETMESRRMKHLYLAGEILDVDGICGGYNLQWAWSSGMLAGKSAGGNL